MACIAGVGYLTPFELWQRKMCFVDDGEVTPQMRAGVALESMILDDYEKEYSVKLECHQMFFKMEEEVNGISFGGTVDAIVKDSDGHNLIVVDAKLNSGYGYSNGIPPQKYVIQMQWYMMLTGAISADLHVFHLPANNFVTYRVERDDSLIESLFALAKSFSMSLRIDCVPDFNQDDKIGEWLRSKWASCMGHVEKHASFSSIEAYEELKVVRESKKGIESREKSLLSVIFNDIGSSERLVDKFDGKLIARLVKDKDGNPKYIKVL